MAVQPTLDVLFPNLNDIQFKIAHGANYYDVLSNTADDAHIHSVFEIYINVSGNVSFLHGSNVTPITNGDVVVSYPSDVHHCIYHSSCVHEHFCIWIAGDVIGNFLYSRGVRGRIRLNEDCKKKIITLATKLANTNNDNFVKTTCLFELISMLASENYEEDNSLEIQSLPDKLREILAYIDTEYLTITCSEDIAKRFYISQATLNRLFKNHVGISVGRLIEAKKLSHAERMLRGNASVTDACYGSGFNDCSRFIERFKNKFGATPLKYKQRLFNT